MTDYIERQAALHAVDEFFHGPKVDVALNAVPSANVRKDVQGEWLNFYGDFSIAECSECAECYEVSPDDEPTEEFFETFKLFYKFCPNCGARMTGGGER